MSTVLASAEVGTATFDLAVPETVRAGSTVPVTIELRGGTRDEHIEGLGLVFEVVASDPEESNIIAVTASLAGTCTVHAGDHRIVEATATVPTRLPVSLGTTTVRVGIDVASRQETAGRLTPPGAASGPKPESRVIAPDGGTTATALFAEGTAGPNPAVEVRAGGRLAQVLDAVSALGFFLRSTRALSLPDRDVPGAWPAPVQELRFAPRWGPFEGEEDLLLYPDPREDRLAVGVERAPWPPDGDETRTADTRKAGTSRDTLIVRDTDRMAVRSDLRQLLRA